MKKIISDELMNEYGIDDITILTDPVTFSPIASVFLFSGERINIKLSYISMLDDQPWAERIIIEEIKVKLRKHKINRIIKKV